MSYKYIVGVDEVGRGPVAGPVYVCAFRVSIDDIESVVNGTELPIRDSKKLTEKTRNKWFEYLKQRKKEGLVDYSISSVSAKEIDLKGISACIKYAISHALQKVIAEDQRRETLVLLDGSLSAPVEFAQRTIIKGDEKESSISFASIIAKVLRDGYMVEQHKKYPHYGFDSHKGYGTQKHMENLRKFGITEEHRVSFLKSL